MSLTFNVPVNSVSFGQLSTALLRHCYSNNIDVNLFPIGKVDVSTQETDEQFNQFLKNSIESAHETHDRQNPAFKLWHLNGSYESVSEKQVLLSFYELDQPTKFELNVASNNHTLFSCEETCELFNSKGVGTDYLPLFFDSHNFKKTDKQYFTDGRIVFNLAGKFEKRKHHEKVIRAWVKKFGNDRRYVLQTSAFNPFLSQEQNEAVLKNALDNKPYFNLNVMGYMHKNSIYNDYLNSASIIIGMSGGEGWGLPEFQSVCIGKHSVVLNASAYKQWANAENSVLVEPNGKIPAYDGHFFKEGANQNQGSIYDFDEDAFIAGCEEAIKRVESNPINESGMKLQQEFTVEKTFNKIQEYLKNA